MTTLIDWFTTFYKILIRPTRETFLEESEKSIGKTVSAYIWLVLLLAGGFLLIYSINRINPPYLYIYGLIIFCLLMPVGFFFYVFCLNFFYKKLFKRKKEIHAELLYLLTSIFVVYAVLSTVPVFIPQPYGIYLSYALLLYLTILYVIAIQALTNLKVWQTIVLLIIGTIIGLGGALCLPAFILSTNNALLNIT